MQSITDFPELSICEYIVKIEVRFMLNIISIIFVTMSSLMH